MASIGIINLGIELAICECRLFSWAAKFLTHFGMLCRLLSLSIVGVVTYAIFSWQVRMFPDMTLAEWQMQVKPFDDLTLYCTLVNLFVGRESCSFV